MIPKIIHYCWFGNKPLTKLAKKCIRSWQKYCPDYKIMLWNEKNYDYNKNRYMKEAYENKKWGFVPDYARLDIIYNYGGIYLDTDVELLRPIDDLLNNDAFFGLEESGKERTTVALGLGFGANRHNKLIKELADSYNEMSFYNSDGSLNLTSSPKYQTHFFAKKGMINTNDVQIIEDAKLFPSEYFNPIDINTGIINITDKTYSIHHYAGSWLDGKSKIKYKIHKIINRFFGTDRVNRIIRIFKKQ